MQRNLGLLGLLGVACGVATHASAAPAPTLFRLALVGTATQEWTYTAAPVETGDCRRTETSEGIRSASFRTKTPVVVRVAGGRVLPVNVKGIMGTVTLGGADTTDEICGGVRNSKIGDCVQTKRTFAKATAHAASPRSGVLTLNRIANVRLAVADCPHEPPDVIRQPLGPTLDLVRLPRTALMQRRFGRITLRTSRTQRKVYGSPEGGRLEATVKWTLTFIRVGK